MESSSRPIRDTELLENLAWVQTLARRLVTDQAEADDVAQDALVAALERPPRRTTLAGLRGWLARVTRSMVRQRRRAETARRLREQAAAPGRSAPSTFDVVARTALQQRIVAAVMELDEPDRTTVLLRHVDGLSARRIAERRGETPAAVRQRLSRARAKLRGRLERELGDDGLHALVPFAFAGVGKSVLPVLGTLGGGALVTKTAMAIGLGAVVVVIGAVAWWSGKNDDVTPPAPPEGEADVALVAPGPAEGVVTTVSALAPPPAEDMPHRVAVAAGEDLPGATYEVLDPAGLPQAAAQVELYADGAVLAHGTTDEEGRFATTLDRPDEGKLVVAAAGWVTQVHPVPLTAARHEVVLSAGEVVSGWVVVDGHAPVEPIELRLRPDQAYVSWEDLGLADDLGAPNLGGSYTRPRVRTGPAGAFRFAGLPAGWSGQLDLPSAYRLRDQKDAASDFFVSSMRLDRAREDVRVEVVRCPVLTGRIVELAADGVTAEPVPGALVAPTLFYPPEISAGPYQLSERTDEEGRFRIGLAGPSIRDGYLRLEPPDGGFRRSVMVGPLELTGDHDLGDIPLVDPAGKQAVALRVQSEAGEPIEGAVAATDHESPVSTPTDAEGRTLLHGVVPGAATLVVCARGWELTTLDVPAEVPDELVVTLRRGAVLELRFRLPDGAPATRVIARVWADVHPFRAAHAPTPYDAYQRAGLTWYQTVRPEDGTVVARMHGGTDARAVLGDVRPGVALRLRVEGSFGSTVHEQDLPPLAPEEWKVVDIDLPRGPRTLRGRVVDEAGAPITSAHYAVNYKRPDSPPTHFSTLGSGVDENGEFEVQDVYESHLHVSVDAEGYVEFRERELEVPLDGHPVEFVLQEGKIVTVTLRDEEGRPLDGSVHSILPSGGYSFGRAVVGEPGAFLMRGLPEHEVEIRASVHDVAYTKTHDPLVPTLEFTIPIHEDLTVTLSGSGDTVLDAQSFFRLYPTDDNPWPRYRQLHEGFEGSFTLPSVIPGRYEAVVSRWLGGEDDEAAWEDISARVPVVVPADAPSSVTIEL